MHLWLQLLEYFVHCCMVIKKTETGAKRFIRHSSCLQFEHGKLGIICKVCAMPYALVTLDQKIKLVWKGNDAEHQSIICVNFEMYYMPVLIMEAKYLRSPASSCSACTSSDSQSCAGVNFYGLGNPSALIAENAIKQVMKKQACVS